MTESTFVLFVSCVCMMVTDDWRDADASALLVELFTYTLTTDVRPILAALGYAWAACAPCEPNVMFTLLI